MADHGVLSAICKALSGDNEIKARGLSDNIYVSAPKIGEFPMVVLEIEEIWTSIMLGRNVPCARLKLKASTLSQNSSGKESLMLADDVRKIVDGKTIGLSDGKQVTLRLENSIVDLPSAGSRPRIVQQYYEAIVRG